MNHRMLDQAEAGQSDESQSTAGAVAAALRDFLGKESAGGIILIFAAALALILANTPFSGTYSEVLARHLAVPLGPLTIDKPLLLWINDGLMAGFFFLVGLEVKREIAEGQLASRETAMLPLVAAIGGMAVPALIFLGVNAGSPETLAGWAIPAATDIAFALAVLTLLGPRVPVALKALLLAIAVIDDLGAIAIIAVFFSHDLDFAMLGAAAVVLGALAALGRMRVASALPYGVLSVILWVFVLKSGIHATLAGVAAALCVPIRARGGVPLLDRFEHSLHPWIAFLVVPIFGFANAGVSLLGVSPSALFAPMPLGIALGLLLGKQIGITGFAWMAVKSGLSRLPEGIGWPQLHALSVIAAIGFTMSLFIGNLAFDDPARIAEIKLGVLAASSLAALGGYALLARVLPRPTSLKGSANA